MGLTRCHDHLVSLKPGVDYPRNFIEFEEFFPDEEAAYRYLERLRWSGGFDALDARRRPLPGGLAEGC